MNQSIPLITVGVAVYNSSATLMKCLKSISAQSFADFEVILVDDGSTDCSGQMLDEYVEKDSRFRVFHQKNAGVGAARNLVIREAKGDYLCFVDPDDWVEPSYLSALREEIYEEGRLCGVVIGGFKKFREDGTFISETDDVEELVMKNQFKDLFGRLKITERGYSCCKLYSMLAIRRAQLSFHEDMPYFEDLIFILELMEYVDYIKIAPKRDYHYVFYSTSSSNRIHSFEKEYGVFCRTEQTIMTQMKKYELDLLACPQAYHTLFVPFLRAIKSDYHHWENVTFRRVRRHLLTLCSGRTTFIKKYLIPDYKIEKLSKVLLVKHCYLLYILLMRLAFALSVQQMYYPKPKD